MKKIITLLTLLIGIHLHSQVGIGTTTPDLSSALDVNSTNTGVLIPRVALTSTSVAAPVTAPVESLLVYNTNTAGDVTPGFYYWSVTVWRRLASGASVVAQNGVNLSTTAPNASISNPYVELGGTLVRNTIVSLAASDMTFDMSGAGNFRVNHFFTTPTNANTYPFGINRGGITEYTIGSDANFVFHQSWNAKPLVINSQGNNTAINPNVGSNVGVGSLFPSNKLDVAAEGRTGTHGTALPFYATGSVGSASSGFEFRHSNGTQGVGIGYNTVYAAGSNAIQDLGLASKSTGNLIFNTNAAERMRISGITGNVGIGATNPAYGLELGGTFGYGNGVAGTYRSRTETRNDAGQIASQSGFFETSVPVNYPAGASSWWHLIDTRHSNNVNNYALQIAGSFFDQELWFRKTNSNGAQAWSRLLTSSSGWSTTGNAGTVAATNFIGTTDGIDFVTRTSNAERMRVTAGGNVGIGIVPSYKLDINGLGGSSVDLRTSGRIWTNSASGGMWLSDLQDSFMGNISTTQMGFWSSSQGWNALNINKVTGYTGIGTFTPSSKLHVVADADGLPVIYGVNSNTSAGTTSYGVRGESGSTGLGSAGVSGVSTNASQNEIGVLGDYSLWGASVFGLGWAGLYTDMPSTRDFGVFGTVNFSTGTGVYGRNTSLTVGSAYGMYCWGNFAVTGAKSASVPTTKGNQLMYCTESPELWFEDIGGGKLTNGSIHIALDPMYMETIFVNDEQPLRVFIQEEGESNGLIVIKDADNKGFTVREKGNGSSNVSFSYRIMAKRRFYQNQRFGVDANQPFEDNLSKAKDQEVTTTDPNEMKRLVQMAAQSKQRK